MTTATDRTIDNRDKIFDHLRVVDRQQWISPQKVENLAQLVGMTYVEGRTNICDVNRYILSLKPEEVPITHDEIRAIIPILPPQVNGGLNEHHEDPTPTTPDEWEERIHKTDHGS